MPSPGFSLQHDFLCKCVSPWALIRVNVPVREKILTPVSGFIPLHASRESQNWARWSNPCVLPRGKLRLTERSRPSSEAEPGESKCPSFCLPSRPSSSRPHSRVACLWSFPAGLAGSLWEHPRGVAAGGGRPRSQPGLAASAHVDSRGSHGHSRLPGGRGGGEGVPRGGLDGVMYKAGRMLMGATNQLCFPPLPHLFCSKINFKQLLFKARGFVVLCLLLYSWSNPPPLHAPTTRRCETGHSTGPR